MDYLNSQVFDPMLKSSLATLKVKEELRGYVAQFEALDAAGMLRLFTQVTGITGRPGKLVQLLDSQGFSRIESIAVDFKVRFNQAWLRA